MEVFAIIAIAIILWMIWQLYRAKRFNRFKVLISEQIKPLVIAHVKSQLADTRNEVYPNTDAHEQATIYFWCQYHSRIIQAALRWKLVEQDWLSKTGNVRNCQHLFHLEQDKLAHYVEDEPESSSTGINN